MLSYMLRKLTRIVYLAKVLNIVALLFSLLIIVGGLMTYDWGRMPYITESVITFEGALTSLGIFCFITFTIAISFYALRRYSVDDPI